MRSKNPTVSINNVAWTKASWIAATQEASVVVFRDEADLLALRLISNSQPQRSRFGPHLVLREPTDRETGVAKLLLRQWPEKICLVFFRILRFSQEDPSCMGIGLKSGIMAGCNAGCLPSKRPMEQRSELDLLVADHARHRSAAGQILSREVCDHRGIKLSFGVGQVVGDSQAASHLAGIVNGFRRATASELPRWVA